jgi:hypothetical protein
LSSDETTAEFREYELSALVTTRPQILRALPDLRHAGDRARADDQS